MVHTNRKVDFSHPASVIRGLEKLARRVVAIPEVRVIKEGNFRNSHVRAGSREPRVTVTDHSVRILHKSGGQMQFLFVFPTKGTSLRQLAEKVQREIDGKNHRSGAGVSSKAPVRIPDHIARRMAMPVSTAVVPTPPPATAVPAAQSPAPAPAATAEESIPVVTDKRILPWHEKAYQKLLSLDPTGKERRFPIGELPAALRKVGYHDDRERHAIEQALRKVGFVVISEEPSGGHSRGRVAYVYRVTGYKVVDGRKERQPRVPQSSPAESGDGNAATPALSEQPHRTRSSRHGAFGAVEALQRFMEDLEPCARQGEKIDFTVEVRKGKVVSSVRIASGDTHNIVHRVR